MSFHFYLVFLFRNCFHRVLESIEWCLVFYSFQVFRCFDFIGSFLLYSTEPRFYRVSKRNIFIYRIGQQWWRCRPASSCNYRARFVCFLLLPFFFTSTEFSLPSFEVVEVAPARGLARRRGRRLRSRPTPTFAAFITISHLGRVLYLVFLTFSFFIFFYRAVILCVGPFLGSRRA